MHGLNDVAEVPKAPSLCRHKAHSAPLTAAQYEQWVLQVSGIVKAMLQTPTGVVIVIILALVIFQHMTAKAGSCHGSQG